MIGDLGAKDATDLAERVARREVSPTELLDAALAAVEARNPALNAVVQMQEGVARKAIADGIPQGPFRGVPFLLKDLGCEAVDFPGHNGSRLLAGTRYRRDSAIYERIRATGVVTFGRTTSPEGGIGAATEAAVYGGPTRNPWNLDHTPGGSSGGGWGCGGSGDRGLCPWLRRRRIGPHSGGKLRSLRIQTHPRTAARWALCRRRLGGDGD